MPMERSRPSRPRTAGGGGAAATAAAAAAAGHPPVVVQQQQQQEQQQQHKKHPPVTAVNMPLPPPPPRSRSRSSSLTQRRGNTHSQQQRHHHQQHQQQQQQQQHHHVHFSTSSGSHSVSDGGSVHSAPGGPQLLHHHHQQGHGSRSHGSSTGSSSERDARDPASTRSSSHFRQQNQHKQQGGSSRKQVAVAVTTTTTTPSPSPSTSTTKTTTTTKSSSSVPPSKQQIKLTRKVIDELKRAAEASPHSQNISDRRIVAMTTACSTFDHRNEERHNMELQQGAAGALAKLLAASTGGTSSGSGSSNNHNNSNHEDSTLTRMISVCLEMIFRGASQASVLMAFQKVGWSQLLPPMLRLLERAEQGTLQHADVTILNLSKVILYASRVPDLRVPLARQAGVLDCLTRVATSILNPESRVCRVRIVANLVHEDENKPWLLGHDGLLDALLRIAHLDLNDVAREYAGVSLMDLASSPRNQISMAKNEKLLGTLVKMVLVEKVAGTRESAITALQNLAFSKENRSRLVAFKQGIVLEALKKALSGDKNDKARRRAAGALTNLACDETADAMGSHKGLLDTLAIVSTKDESTEVQTRAAMALTKLAASITFRMKCYPTLLDALVVASLSPASNSVSAVLRVKARDPENRPSMAEHPGILDTLADTCLNPSSRSMSSAKLTTTNTTTTTTSFSTADVLKDKDNAMRALMHLTNESQNRIRMCTPRILDALVDGATLPDGDPQEEEIRDSAIRAIERLATDFANRAIMAHHKGLLVAVAQATEREARLEAEALATAKKNLVTSPAVRDTPNDSEKDRRSPTPLQQQQPAYLAKPLLMSLLVAM